MKNWKRTPFRFWLFLFIISTVSCANTKPLPVSNNTQKAETDLSELDKRDKSVILGAARFKEYLPALKGKKVGMIVNQTSVINNEHLVDILLAKKVNITTIFAPEHGFRGEADAGELVDNGKDIKTGLPIISLYGENRKPNPEMIQDVDVLVFDIQDVGVRFYTYISTMHYIMEAAAENNKSVIILDRPNPNGHYVDGPILEMEHQSFVGMHPIPIVHGLTVGELARMINGELWLADSLVCNLKVVKCLNYDHNTFYVPPIKPSPNLPNIRSIYLYPSLCLFEGTVVSVGRGTATPFQIYGHPLYPKGKYDFIPSPTEGAKFPRYDGELCHGFSLLDEPIEQLRKAKKIRLEYLVGFYNCFPEKDNFFNDFFIKLVGTNDLQKQIVNGRWAVDIEDSWDEGLNAFKKLRKKYLLYTDFE